MKIQKFTYKLLLMCFCLVITYKASSQISLISDLNDKPLGTNFGRFVQAQDFTYFIANNSLWRTDGTTEGTILLTNTNIEYNTLEYGNCELIGNKLFFFKDGNTAEDGLWISDGSKAGTQQIRGLYTYGPIARLHDFVFFTAADNEHGTELWRTDGTESGINMVKDINQGSDASYPDNFIHGDGFIIFSCRDSNHLYKAWRSDGTDAGTFLIANIGIRASTSKDYFYSFNFKGYLYFEGNDGVHGFELWKTDGTVNGTTMMKDIFPGKEGSFPNQFISTSNYLFFLAMDKKNGYKLWRTDGTEMGTSIVFNISYSLSGFSVHYQVADDQLFFVFNQNGHSYLWKTDGTLAGTTFIKEHYFPDNGFYFNFLCYENGFVYFNGYDSIHGNELWKSDGTPEGTMLEKDITPGIASTKLNYLFTDQGKLYLTIVDDTIYNYYRDIWVYDLLDKQITILNDYNNAGGYFNNLSKANSAWYIFIADDSISGEELWGTDGTPENTMLIKDITPGTVGYQIYGSTVWKNELYFVTGDYNDDAQYLYKTDGTKENIKLIKKFKYTDQSVFQSTAQTNQLMFFAMGNELWLTDGTEAGTKLIKVFFKSSSYSQSITDLTYLNGVLYFFARDSIHGWALWKSDGTSIGTKIVKGIHTGTSNSYPSINIFPFGNQFVFIGIDSLHGREAWISDGTEAGTHIIKDIFPGPSGCIHNFTLYHNKIFIEARDSTHDHELWITDGTENGTYMVKDIYPGGMGSYFNQPVEFHDKLYFLANDSTNRIGLYCSDGTNSGTLPVKNFYSNKGDYIGFNSIKKTDSFFLFTIYYWNSDSLEMWRSDGSTPGTYVIKKERLKDNNYYNLDKGIVLKNKIYFPFEDSVSGNELWCSDGTEDGTYMVGEVNIGISSSELNEFNTNGKEIFFTAYSEFYGTEWYKYIPSAAPSTQTSGVEFFNVRTKQFSLKWKRGNGDKSLVFIKKGNSGAAIVHDNSNYIPSNVYPFGERSIDPQWFCVYNGIDTIITVYGLQPGTEYRVMAIGYNESEGGFYYNSSMSYLNPNNQYTLMDREGNENLEINYFPNPTAGKVYILNSQNSRIFLYNYTGKLIFDIQVQEEPNIIDLSQYPNGMYFLKIVTGSKSITKKVILYKLGG